MPRPFGNTTTPKYRHHKPSGRAVTTINGKDFYLGPYGSKASRAEYDRLIGEWLSAGRAITPGGDDGTALMVIVDAFWKHVESYYLTPGGSRGEINSYKIALQVVTRLYGHHDARQFGPLALNAVRQDMVKAGWSRGYINSQIGRIRRMFKWAAAQELIPHTVWEALRAVDGLRAGKTDARESQPVTPVPDETIAATLPHVAPQVAAMIRLQLLTGMRPGEVCTMRGSELDTSAEQGVWVYLPNTHKTKHRGHERAIYLGPKCQQILLPFLKGDATASLFSPAEADAWHRQRRAAARKTPMSCGNVAGSNRKSKPQRRPRDRYRVNSYGAAIKRACEKAFPPPEPLGRYKGETLSEWANRLTDKQRADLQQWRRDHAWHPHQLRHSAATRLRREFGLEAAQVILGHQTLTVTQVYAEKNVEAARRVMKEVG